MEYNKCIAGCFGVALSLITTSAAAASPDRFKAHMSLLADDLLMGRETGSIGHDFASLYIATELQKLGLKPAGENNSFYQPIRFKQALLDMKSPKMTVSDGQNHIEFRFMQDMLMGPDMNRQHSELEAELVFVGFGIDAPFLEYSDLNDIDLKGKIAVKLKGKPQDFPSEEGSHYASQSTQALVERGAIGIISLSTPTSEKVFPFEKGSLYVRSPSVRWIDKTGKVKRGYPQIQGSASLSIEASKQLMKLAGVDLAKIYRDIADNKQPKARALGLTAKLTKSSSHKEVTSPNVIGLLEGSDPTLKDEYIILTAHSDHIGVSKDSVLKDRINNGAMDNASGVTTTLEMAYQFAHAKQKPKRSVLFAFVTGEERGLLGSDYYAHNPTVPLENIVANVNLDMPILTYRTNEMIAFGAQHSSMKPIVETALQKNEMKLVPDPMPEQALFVRSDQYSLVKKGIPAVFLVPSLQVESKNALGISPMDFIKNHYHMPSDDLNLPIDYEWAAQFVDINYEIALELANAKERPDWNQDSFFNTIAP